MAGITSKSEIERATKAEIMKKYGPKIKSDFGQDEYNFIKDDATGPGGIDRLRKHVLDLFMSKGGMAKKRMSKGGTATKVAPKRMRGGGMAKMAAKKMRGGGVAAKKMRGGGMAKMASKKKMMRGGMAKKK